MRIDWVKRFKNKIFWTTMIPAILLLLQQIALLFGFSIDLTEIQEQLVAIIGTVFAILSILGIAVDTSTSGLSDKDYK